MRAVRLAAALLLSLLPHAVRADSIELTTGGVLRGELLGDPAAIEKSQTLTLRTLSGATVTIDRAQVLSVVRRRKVLEEYETRRRHAPDTLDGQWELAEWCRERNLPRQRAVHLARVIEFDPDHARARRVLGYTWHEGRWTTHDDLMTARGYVRHKGRYVLPQELELLLEEQRETESERAWFKRVRLWKSWLDNESLERQAAGAASLRSIADPDAVRALARTLKDEEIEGHRILYVGVLARIAGEKPIEPLIRQSLYDESRLVRDAAVSGVRGKDVTKVLPTYLRALKNEQNAVVNRAGSALAALGDESVVPQLIEALVTRHRYRVQVPINEPFGFRSDGGMVSNAPPLPRDIAVMLATGQLPYGVRIEYVQPPGVPLRMKTATVHRDEQNPSVLSALGVLTGQNLGYDEKAWKSWYAAHQSGTLKKKSRA
jgi:hypothetical protein